MRTFKTVHEIAIDEWTGVHGDFEPENTEFGELFLKRCLDAGIRQANLRKLSFDVEGAPYFCLANSAAEHAGECRLAICGAIYNGDDFEKLILRICKVRGFSTLRLRKRTAPCNSTVPMCKRYVK